jgi:hypothetical protein
MGMPRFSIVIPTRERAGTLRYTLQTCLAQEFDDVEIVVSDNQSSPATRQLVADLADRRLKYCRTPSLLAMTDSWEFAVEQASGEYVTVLGDDDALLPHALPEIDRLLRMLDTTVLHWEAVCYNWPDMPPQEYASPNELLIPLKQVNYFHPIRRCQSHAVIRAAANRQVSYAQLPMIYCSAVRRGAIDLLRQRVGRVFRSRSPDIYSSFALAYLCASYYSVAAPITINGLSGKSNGVACLYLKGKSPIAEEFSSLNAAARHACHRTVPDLPVMAAGIADSFQHAKDVLFPNDDSLTIDRRQLLVSCLEELPALGPQEWQRVLAAIRRAIADDASLLAWFEIEYGHRPAAPVSTVRPRPVLKRYGGTYLHLDAAAFGVRDVFAAAQLCEQLLGYKADGLNAHLEPQPAPAPKVQPLCWQLPVPQPAEPDLWERLRRAARALAGWLPVPGRWPLRQLHLAAKRDRPPPAQVP